MGVAAKTLREVIAAVDRAAVQPPDGLDEKARAMFVEIADGNRARAWNIAHVSALAHYCRVVVSWEREFEAFEREGSTVDGKPSPRLRTMRSLEGARLRFARLLGLMAGQGAILL